MKVLVFFFLSTVLVCSARDWRNFVFIMVDDLGYGDLGCYGGEHIETPNIDQLADEGMRFTQCYSGAPVCAPARSVLMTGQHMGHTTVRGNFSKVPGVGVVGLGGGKGRVPLKADDQTVAEALKQSNYVTGMVGKWGLGEPGTTGEPNKQGFDFFFGHLNQRRAHTFFPTYLWQNDKKVPYPENEDGKKGTHSHPEFVRETLAFIDRHGGADKPKPFFLYVPWTIPHDKLEPPTLEPYEDKPWSEKAKAYAASITQMDEDVGRIMDLLKAKKIDQNTAVFFCSDNGAANRYEGELDSSGELRGRKRDLYEGGIRVPMVVRWPARVKPGTVSEAVWSFADVKPTLIDLSGQTPSAVAGLPLSRTLFGLSQEKLARRHLYWEFYEGGFKRAVRYKQWKAVWPKHDEPPELYDLSADPGEMSNVATEHPEVVRDMTFRADVSHRKSKAWPAPIDR